MSVSVLRAPITPHTLKGRRLPNRVSGIGRRHSLSSTDCNLKPNFIWPSKGL
jgi:hypothetical protein